MTTEVKTDTEIIRVHRLTRTAVSMISEECLLVEDYQGDHFTSGATFIVSTRRLLEASADRLESLIDDFADAAANMCDTDSQIEFAERSARRSILTAITRIRLALAGQSQPKKIHIPQSSLRRPV